VSITAADLRRMLAGIPDDAEIVIESCCRTGCVLTPKRIEPNRLDADDVGPLGDGTLIVITQD